MPVYEYKCDGCDEIIEKVVEYKDADETIICDCGGRAYRILSLSNLRFIGRGWQTPKKVGRKRMRDLE